MFAKSRLPNRLSPKRTIAQKYPLRPKYHGQMHHTIDANRYYTRPSEDYNEDYAATRERVDYRQRNHTENKHNRHSAVTINLRSKTGHSYLKSQSYSNSKSENLSKGKYIFKPTEDLKEEKLLMVREERLSKLKEGYNLKNRMNAEKKVHSSVYNSNDRLNSLGDLRNKKLLVHSK
jgi:phage protein D